MRRLIRCRPHPCVQGESVLLSGILYTGRDAAHKRLCALIKEGKPLPFDLKNQVIYYAGPCPAKPETPLVHAAPQPAIVWMRMRPCCVTEGSSA